MSAVNAFSPSWGRLSSVNELRSYFAQNMLEGVDIVCPHQKVLSDYRLFDFAGARLWHVSSTPLEAIRRGTANRGRIRPVAILQLEGESYLTHEGKICSLQPGSFAFVDAAKPYRLKHVSDFRQLCLQFPGEAFSSLEWRAATMITMKKQTPIDHPFFECGTNLWEAAPFMHLQQHSAAVSALMSLAKLTTAFSCHKPEVETSIRVRRAMAFIENHLGDASLSAEVVASREGVSRRYLDELFVEGGHRINAWIWERRLARAAEMLSLPDFADRTLLQVALDLGFKTPSHFSRAFSERFGASPREYRKLHLLQQAHVGGGEDSRH